MNSKPRTEPALEYLTGFGGAILDESGRVVVDSPAAIRALSCLSESERRLIARAYFRGLTAREASTREGDRRSHLALRGADGADHALTAAPRVRQRPLAHRRAGVGDRDDGQERAARHLDRRGSRRRGRLLQGVRRA